MISSRLDVSDIFGDTNVTANPDQSWSLIVEQKLELLQTDSVVQLNDTLAVDIFNLPFTFKIPPGQKVIEKQNTSRIDFGVMELTHARPHTAKMKFYVTNTIEQPLFVEYKLYSAIKDGVVYEVTEDVPAATDTSNAYVIKTINLDGYDIDLTGPNGDDFNTLYAITTVWIHPDGDTAIVGPTDSVIIISTFEEFGPEYARGYLGSQSFNDQSSSAINVFGDFKSGTFDLQNVKAGIDIFNFLGTDLSLEINSISTKKNSPPIEEVLNHPIIGSSLNIDRGAESNIPEYPVYPKHYYYDISNSNLDKMIEIMPDSLLFNISAIMNPLGNISSGNDFIYFSKGLEASIKLDIPLNFSANNLVIEDYSSFSFDSEKVNGGVLNIYLDNLFPFDLDVQFYLLDEQNQIIDSLITDNISILAGIPNNGIVQKGTQSEVQIILTESLINNLLQSKQMLIRAKINSAQNQAFQLYEHYGLDIKIVGDFEYEI